MNTSNSAFLIEQLKSFKITKNEKSNHDQRMGNLRATLKTRSQNTTLELKLIAQRIFDIADQGLFILSLFEVKLTYLADALIHGIDSNNPLSVANNSRSIVEQVATVNFLFNKLSKLNSSLEGHNSLKNIDLEIAKIEKHLQRTYYGDNIKKTTQKHKAIHTSESIENFTAEASDASEIYDFLCEYVHPNFSNNLLVSAGVIASGDLGFSAESNYEHVNQIASKTIAVLSFFQSKNLAYAASLWGLQTTVEHCCKPGAKLSNIFSVRTPKPVGDGKSQDTAFFFKNARSSDEAKKFSYALINDLRKMKKLSPLDDEGLSTRQLGGIDKEYIYDIWKVNDEDVWIKMPWYTGMM